MEDPIAPSRGCLVGLLLVALIWISIVILIYFAVFMFRQVA